VKQSFDELFDIPFVFSAIPDVFTDIRKFIIGFNAGVLAIKPDSKVFDDMMTKIYRNNYNHWDAEQGFLNVYYGHQVIRLPYVYNANLAVKSAGRKFWEAIQDQMRIVHFTLTKPFDIWARCGDRACTVAELWDVNRQRGTLESAKAHMDGLHKEEIEWWETLYDDMLANVRTDHCSHA